MQPLVDDACAPDGRQGAVPVLLPVHLQLVQIRHGDLEVLTADPAQSRVP